VLGTQRLRVIDGSVLQEREVSVNHVTVQAIAELGSAMIKETWKTNKPIPTARATRRARTFFRNW